MRALISIILGAFALSAQQPIPGPASVAGGGYTAPSGYSATVTAQTTLTVTAATHGQGTAPTAWCFDNASPALNVACSYTVSSIGDVVFTWSPAFTGTVIIRGPGANAGAAGDVVGPSSSTNTALACFSGTSGKIIAGCSALSTTGAIPYVTSAGVLGQDATALFWDATNDRLGVGTNAPGKRVSIIGATGDGIDFTNSSAAAGRGNFSLTAGIAGYLNEGMALSEVYESTDVFHLTTYQKQLFLGGRSNTNTDTSVTILNGQSKGEILRVNSTSPIVVRSGGNLLLGGTTDGNYKFDVAASGSSGTARFYDQTATTGTTNVVIRAGAGQTGNLTEWQNSAGTVLSFVSGGGVFRAAGFGDGGEGVNLSSSGLSVKSSGVFSFSNSGFYYGTADAGLKRAAANYVAVTDGSSGLGKIVVSQATPSASTDACTAGALWADTTYFYACTASGTIKRVTLNAF